MNRVLNSIHVFADVGVVSSTVKGLSKCLINHESRRFGRRYRKSYSWPNDFLPFKWERPAQEPPYLRTGDSIKDIGMWNPKDLVAGAEFSEELKNAPEIVRRLFTLELATRRDVVQYQMNKIVQEVQRHPFDVLSPEVRIAQMTVKIRNNLYYFTKIDNQDSRRKIRQDFLVSKRSVLLKELYYQDRERYEYIKKKLGITHTPPVLGEKYSKPTRKGELRRLTTEYCEKIKQEKLDKYHEELKANQESLKKEMEQVEELVKSEEKFLGTINNSKN